MHCTMDWVDKCILLYLQIVHRDFLITIALIQSEEEEIKFL